MATTPQGHWPDVLAHDHGLRGRVDVFIDESGPREDKTLALGMLLVESEFAEAAHDFLERLAADLESDHPALTAAKYEGEWKGRLLARATASRHERREVGRGASLGDVARQAVYARCLDAVQLMPRARGFGLTYRWTGPVGGPDDVKGYRIRRVIQHALSALSFQVVDVRHAYIDDGHAPHYTAGILEYANSTGSGPVPHDFVRTPLPIAGSRSLIWSRSPLTRVASLAARACFRRRTRGLTASSATAWSAQVPIRTTT